MAIAADHMIKLRDGRTLGYAEYGDPYGRPILHMHGFPSSRFEGKHQTLVDIAARWNAHIFVLERPGVGNSDFRPQSSIADWAGVVAQFADALGLDRFILMAASAGCPYVLACACAFPERVYKVGIISGLGPLDAPGALDGMAPLVRHLFSTSLQAPSLVPVMMWPFARAFHLAPRLYTRMLTSGMTLPDRSVLDAKEGREMAQGMVMGAFQAGSRGAVQDLLLVSKPWKFEVAGIRVPVYLWHGEADNTVPPSHARLLANQIPHCRVRFYPNEGHFSLIIRHLDEILPDLLA